MNDRFESLMYHAGMTAQGCWDEMDSYQREAVEKFAQLIVRECIGVIEGMADPEEDSDRYFWAIQNASAKVREHFGVDG